MIHLLGMPLIPFSLNWEIEEVGDRPTKVFKLCETFLSQ